MRDLILRPVRSQSTGEVKMVAADEATAAYLAKLKPGQGLAVKAKKLRSVRQNALIWALVDKVAENTDQYVNGEALMTALKIALGHCDVIMDFETGELIRQEKSIAFDAFPPEQFRQFFDRAVDLLVKHVIPGTGREDLMAEVLEMVGDRRAA